MVDEKQLKIANKSGSILFWLITFILAIGSGYFLSIFFRFFFTPIIYEVTGSFGMGLAFLFLVPSLLIISVGLIFLFFFIYYKGSMFLKKKFSQKNTKKEDTDQLTLNKYLGIVLIIVLVATSIGTALRLYTYQPPPQGTDKYSLEVESNDHTTVYAPIPKKNGSAINQEHIEIVDGNGSTQVIHTKYGEMLKVKTPNKIKIKIHKGYKETKYASKFFSAPLTTSNIRIDSHGSNSGSLMFYRKPNSPETQITLNFKRKSYSWVTMDPLSLELDKGWNQINTTYTFMHVD
ncbi:MAG: hypothetical protein BTN85_1239 [Candidatus Methanohalarchaeum thermophilum]|uniref:Uncharacterized protein n=1 Tax=Methanohalarchaeum thermophilum TaxID=1903181 RepID=A0A1Q6DWH6_METT1|nr:MAG: hypothetical protein BTN85_1239 [Candidatus Methanohalarchaeum thermophilum]